MNKPNRWQAIIYASALFVFGVIIGAIGMSRMAKNSETLRVGRSEEIVTLIRDRLVTRLELTPDQEKQIKPFVLKTADDLDSIHRDCLRQVNEALDKMHVQISPELIPEQKQKMLELEAERRERMWTKYHYRVAETNITAR